MIKRRKTQKTSEFLKNYNGPVKINAREANELNKNGTIILKLTLKDKVLLLFQGLKRGCDDTFI